MKSEITFRRQLRRRGLELKRRKDRPDLTIINYLVYNKQGYVVAGDESPITLEEIQKLLDDPNSVFNKEL